MTQWLHMLADIFIDQDHLAVVGHIVTQPEFIYLGRWRSIWQFPNSIYLEEFAGSALH